MATDQDDSKVDWSKTTFEGSREEQLRRAQAMTMRERLEALDRMTSLAERMRTMPRHPPERTDDGSVKEPRPRYDSTRPVNEIILAGCAPTPLAGYLKALGVLRLLSAKYPETRGFWRGDRYGLWTSVGLTEIESFFLTEYQPTPVVAPWNGGSGFFEKDNKAALHAILHGDSPRFAAYREAITDAERALAGCDRSTSPKEGDKTALLTRLRSLLPEAAVVWFDAAVTLASESQKYPPLLGTGGNDGRLDFTNNFMQRLIEVVGADRGATMAGSAVWLKASLYAESCPGMVSKAIGQFAPCNAGGSNASNGYEADGAINPWDYVLMVEGAVMFASATARRNADDPWGVMSYPFTVRSIGAGAGNVAESDGESGQTRGELWMPLWGQPATTSEIQALLTEGRVALGRRPARDAMDLVRAIHRLGGYRGVTSFQRFGILKRFGKNYLATPLSRVVVRESTCAPFADELDNQEWLERFRQFARGDTCANRFRSLRKQLEDQLFDLSGREPTSSEMQFLLILLGSIHRALSTSDKARESVRPVPRLSERWVSAADDGTPEFRIAKAIAGIQGYAGDWLPLCAQLFPVHRMNRNWVTAKNLDDVRVCSGSRGRLVELFATLLEKRLWLAERLELKDKPLSSPAGATLDDVAAFLRDDRMDARIAALLPGLSLCRIPEDTQRGAGEAMLPAAFGLMKLALTPDRILRSVGHLRDNNRVPVPAGMVAQLTAGNHGNRAVAIAWRRLRASGLAPFFTNTVPGLSGVAPDRAAAALLIPLRWSATKALARTLLEEPETQAEPAITENSEETHDES